MSDIIMSLDDRSGSMSEHFYMDKLKGCVLCDLGHKPKKVFMFSDIHLHKPVIISESLMQKFRNMAKFGVGSYRNRNKSKRLLKKLAKRAQNQ